MDDEFEALGDLLTALASLDPRIRGHAAHRVLDFAEAAVDALFQAIARPENRDHIGTLVYVLRAFNLALHGHFEVQNHALSILSGQSFDVTAEQLRLAERALDELKARENLPTEDVELLRDDLRLVLSRLGESMRRTP